jgi:hypothetical protein
MMAVNRRNMQEWINVLYMYLYVQVVGFVKCNIRQDCNRSRGLNGSRITLHHVGSEKT